MNNSEFNSWWADLTTRWPSVNTWLAKCFPEQSQQRAMLRTWLEVLASVNLADCLEVNRKMQSGELGWVGEYDADKERLPQHVRRLARQNAWDARGSLRSEPVSELKPVAFPAGKIIRRILELTDSGVSRDEARAMVLKELPVGRPAYEPRFNCLACLDAGVVTVASPTAIQMALAEVFHECHHREAVMRCPCSAHKNNPKHQLAVYDSEKDYRVADFLWGEAETNRFHDWCESKRTEFWESKRHHEFDSFNQRAFAP